MCWRHFKIASNNTQLGREQWEEKIFCDIVVFWAVLCFLSELIELRSSVDFCYTLFITVHNTVFINLQCLPSHEAQAPARL